MHRAAAVKSRSSWSSDRVHRAVAVRVGAVGAVTECIVLRLLESEQSKQ